MFTARLKQHIRPDEPDKERPDLSLEMSLVKFVPNKPPQVNIVIRNRGQRTAYKIRFQGQDFLKPRGFADRLNPVQNDVWDIYPSLAVDAVFTAFTLSGKSVTAKEIGEIIEGELLFLHFARGRYEDKEGQIYPFDLCFKYHPSDQHFNHPNSLSIAPAEYWPEEMNRSELNPN